MLQPLSRWWPRALVASVMVVGLAQLSSAFLADTTSRVSTCATQERHTNVASVGQNFGAELALFEEGVVSCRIVEPARMVARPMLMRRPQMN